jgi:hypothetical protein
MLRAKNNRKQLPKARGHWKITGEQGFTSQGGHRQITRKQGGCRGVAGGLQGGCSGVAGEYQPQLLKVANNSRKQEKCDHRGSQGSRGVTKGSRGGVKGMAKS